MNLLKNVITLISVVSFSITSCYANEAISVKKGEPAKYDGTLMDKEMSEQVRDDLIEKDALEKINKSQEKQILLYKSNEIVYNEQKSLLLNQNTDLIKTLNTTRSTTTIEKVGLILLGIGLTVGAGWAITRAGR